MKIVGIKFVSFKDRNGKEVSGVKLHLVDEAIKLDAGHPVESVFLSTAKMLATCGQVELSDLGSECQVFYNKYGKVDSVSIG